ncbi:hypothetical protein D3C77_583210 [compost metagenome]
MPLVVREFRTQDVLRVSVVGAFMRCESCESNAFIRIDNKIDTACRHLRKREVIEQHIGDAVGLVGGQRAISF